QEVRQMPGDKMIILAEGQGPIFADKLRFFRTMPFREMERFSQAHLPDVPSTEFLPQRPVPATTLRYAGEVEGDRPEGDATDGGEQQKVPARDLRSNTGLSRQAPARRKPASGGKAKQPVPPASPSADSIEARFIPAARKLRILVQARSERSRTGTGDIDWSRVFDETVPDAMEIAEAGTS